ncbi:NIPSNAP family protein [Paenibacillus provencensis]|uniref:NIPSNAP family protein n=1 Tax=Paenibacillus provencensis TaxID=441151 RepID=A0ABW3PN84_9BACL|nr:NIPSNAP family protein [Paenibacillus sp. MER 78]MCM3127543.1 NIPSNAP family protein [Paenibacillus sp. MER 78]
MKLILFNEVLLPTQLKYGVRLIGRWQTTLNEDTSEIFAMWEYDSLEQYDEIESKIKSDVEHVSKVQQRLDAIGRDRLQEALLKDIKQEFFTTTVKREQTILKTLI